MNDNLKEIIDTYIKNNLSIDIEKNCVYTIVTLKLNGKIISSSKVM